MFEEVPISGTVSSPRVTQLSPEVPGLVQEVLVDAGDRVEAGAPLVRLDGTLAGLALEAAEAATAQASEELADARRRLADAERLVQSRGIAETEIKARRSEVRADAATLRLRQAEQRREAERLRQFACETLGPDPEDATVDAAEVDDLARRVVEAVPGEDERAAG